MGGEIEGCSRERTATDTNGKRREKRRTDSSGGQDRTKNETRMDNRVERSGGERTTPDTGSGDAEQRKPRFEPQSWENFPTQSPICDRNDELSSKLVDITFSKWRQEAIKAMGNAVVPTLILQIFKAIQQYNELEKGSNL